MLLSGEYLWDLAVALVAFLNVYIFLGKWMKSKHSQEKSDLERAQNSLYMLNDTTPPAGVILSNLGLYLISLHAFARRKKRTHCVQIFLSEADMNKQGLFR